MLMIDDAKDVLKACKLVLEKSQAAIDRLPNEQGDDADYHAYAYAI